MIVDDKVINNKFRSEILDEYFIISSLVLFPLLSPNSTSFAITDRFKTSAMSPLASSIGTSSNLLQIDSKAFLYLENLKNLHKIITPPDF